MSVAIIAGSSGLVGSEASRFLHAKGLEELSGQSLQWALSPQARSGDHQWWVSDVRKFQRDYPGWIYRYDHKAILGELIAAVSPNIQI